MKTLEDFTKKQSPKRRKSKLSKYAKEIKKLYNMGYSVPQIREFLSENGIKITERAIFQFFSKKDTESAKYVTNNVAGKTRKTVGGLKNETKKPKDLNQLKKEFNENPVFDSFKNRMKKSKELQEKDKEIQ